VSSRFFSPANVNAPSSASLVIVLTFCCAMPITSATTWSQWKSRCRWLKQCTCFAYLRACVRVRVYVRVCVCVCVCVCVRAWVCARAVTGNQL
jgi:hypothetical protein